MSPKILTLTALMVCALACQSARAPEAIAPQAPATQATDVQGVPIDPEEMKKTLLSRDTDGDGVNDWDDNCQLLPNPLQSNQDGDKAGDLCDACPTEAGNVQLGCPQKVRPREPISRDDWRARYSGSDWDQDGVPMPQDNCPLDANPKQTDGDGDGWGAACDRCDNEASPDTVDGCMASTRWAVDVDIETDPQGFCLETCEVLETCHNITFRFPGETGSQVRAQCETSCKTDPAMRDRLNTLGSSATFLTTGCDLPRDLQKTFRLWDTFGCDQLYCYKLEKNCGPEYRTYEDQNACIASCLDFGAYNQKRSSADPTEVGINCLIDGAQGASDSASCSLALVENSICPRL